MIGGYSHALIECNAVVNLCGYDITKVIFSCQVEKCYDRTAMFCSQIFTNVMTYYKEFSENSLLFLRLPY